MSETEIEQGNFLIAPEDRCGDFIQSYSIDYENGEDKGFWIVCATDVDDLIALLTKARELEKKLKWRW